MSAEIERIPSARWNMYARVMRIDEALRRGEQFPEVRPAAVPEENWLLTRRHCIGRESIREIAAARGVSPTAVRDRVNRTVRRVARALEREARMCPHCQGTGMAPKGAVEVDVV